MNPFIYKKGRKGKKKSGPWSPGILEVSQYGSILFFLEKDNTYWAMVL